MATSESKCYVVYDYSPCFASKLANPLFKSATADMIRWQSGDIIYVQAYANGCESSDWVLLYTVTA